MAPIFYCPVASDRLAECFSVEFDLAGVERNFLGCLPEAGSGVLVPNQARDPGGLDDQAVPLGIEFVLNVEGLDLAGFMTAMAFGINALEALDWRLLGGDLLERGQRPGWLVLTWASSALPLSRAASKVFLTMQSVGSEQHTAQAQLGDHLLGSRNFIALDVDFGVRQQDRGIRGEGA